MKNIFPKIKSGLKQNVYFQYTLIVYWIHKIYQYNQYTKYNARLRVYMGEARVYTGEARVCMGEARVCMGEAECAWVRPECAGVRPEVNTCTSWSDAFGAEIPAGVSKWCQVTDKMRESSLYQELIYEYWIIYLRNILNSEI